MVQVKTLIERFFLLPGRNLFYWKSSISWSSLQWCSRETEDIPVADEAGQHVAVWKAVGRHPAGPLLQLQGSFYFIRSVFGLSYATFGQLM